MKKQIIKAFTLSSLILLFTCAAATVASAQQPIERSRYTASIPFAFTVGNKTLPAGQYTVQYRQTSSGHVLLHLDTENQDAVTSLTQPVRASARSTKTTLVFNRYGEQYFLAEMWRAGDTEGRQLGKSGRERAIERELAEQRQQNQPAEQETATMTIALTPLAK